MFELSCQEKVIAAWTNLKLCEELIDREKVKDDKTYSRLREALTHVLLATKAHLMFRTGREAEAKLVSTEN